MLSNVSWITRLTSFVFLVSILCINAEQDRTAFVWLITYYSVAFASYLYLIKRNELRFKQLAVLAISAQVVSLVFEPHLSVDYYRFLWDGEMAWNHINPFDFRPIGVHNQPFIRENPYLNEIYTGMSRLSRYNYSCYPTVNQLYFIFSTAFSSSIAINTFFLKLSIVTTELIGAIYLVKIFKKLNLNNNRMWILYLNPLWIIECTGNTHFEGVMISFLFIALYFILQKRIVLGGIWMAIAVQIKLIPLLFLPFFLRYLGWWKASLFYTITIGLAISLGIIHLDQNNFWHFIESIILYFKVFEFNSLFFYNILQIGKMYYSFNPIRIFGPIISQISLFLILILAFWGNDHLAKKMFHRMTIAFFIYLLLSSTVHPWYIIPLLAVSSFTHFSFPIIWSFFIFFSYFLYSVNSGSAIEVRALITIEYTIVIGVFIYELIKKKPLLQFLNFEFKNS